MLQKQIINRLDQLIKYLDPLLIIANSHMVDFFTHNIYENHIPLEIQNEINQNNYDVILNLIYNPFRTNSNCPALQKFLVDCTNNTLPNFSDVCLNLKDIQLKLIDLGCQNLSGLHLEGFMTSKKSHEVEIMTEISAALSEISKTSHIIDIGDGKGYLSSALALHNGLKVLGVDSSDINTRSAAKRVGKLNKLWKSVTNDNTCHNGNELYKQTTKFVTEDIDLICLVKEQYPEDNVVDLSLVGLHTCGNLAPSCLKLFIQNSNVKTICNVGCCYHLLNENFETDNGFPMSTYLKQKRFSLGRNARMVSCQSLERIIDKKELPSKILFYRSLLQILLEKYNPSLIDKQVGRFGQKATTFIKYIEKAYKKFEANLSIPESEILELHDFYKPREIYLQIFYLLRAYIAPVIEGVILLDRLLYLHEQGIEKSFLVQLFDPVISPRCYGIIAFKNNV